MNPIKIIAFAQCYNELTRGYLYKIIDHYTSFADHLIILDDASTDGTKEKLLELESKFRDKYTILTNTENMWQKNMEVENKIRLHAQAIAFDPDLIISFDFDEFYSANVTRESFVSLYHFLKSTGYKAATYPWISLWLSFQYYRVDKLGQVSPPRVWIHEPYNKKEKTGDVIEFKEGLHQQLWPTSINPNNMCFVSSMKLLHYSSVELENLMEKVKYYKKTNPNYNPTDLFTGPASIIESDYRWFEGADPNPPDWNVYVKHLKFCHDELMKAWEE